MKGHQDYALHHVGGWTYGHPNIPRADEAEPLTIGRFCLIASGVTSFLGNEHRVDWVSTYPFAVLYSIVGGVPARHIRYRFDESARKLLQQIAWWDWPLEKIREAFPVLMPPDIQRFF